MILKTGKPEQSAVSLRFAPVTGLREVGRGRGEGEGWVNREQSYPFLSLSRKQLGFMG